MNVYGYVGGNPIDFVDPEGLAGVRRGGRTSGSPAQETLEIIHTATVNRTVEQIRTYDPNFRYAIIARPGYRYNQQDVELVNDLLQQYQNSQACTANGLPRPAINYGSTPNGVPFTRHYGAETGPVRNLPGSLIDHVISTGNRTFGSDGRAIYYDPVNNLTVVTGARGVMSAHKE